MTQSNILRIKKDTINKKTLNILWLREYPHCILSEEYNCSKRKDLCSNFCSLFLLIGWQPFNIKKTYRCDESRSELVSWRFVSPKQETGRTATRSPCRSTTSLTRLQCCWPHTYTRMGHEEHCHLRVCSANNKCSCPVSKYVCVSSSSSWCKKGVTKCVDFIIIKMISCIKNYSV